VKFPISTRTAVAALLVSASALCACAQTPQKAADTTTATSMNASPARRMTIGSGDLLSIAVFDTPELSGQIRVDENGDASFPLIGNLHVAGLSTTDAQNLIAKRLAQGDFVKEPQVTVLISEYATQGITVMGEVMKPGIYPAIGGKRLFDMISLASGLTPLAGTTVTVTHREHPDQPVTLPLRDANGDISTSNVELQPGDTVIVQRAGIVYVLGDVGKPGGFVMDREHVTVLEAIALAQGTTKTSSLNKARLIRKSPSGIEQTKLPLKSILSAKAADPELQPGDIVYVPGSLPKNAMQMGVQGILSSAIGASIYVASGR
jgi:polysaccharide export outer membrane protein